MYTGHFGLDDGPFHGQAQRDVYVGPQQAVVVGRLKKVLSLADTVVAVSGPTGAGKTALVRHTLAGIAGRKILVCVDRIRLEPDEVLDLLLARFDVSRPPRGTIQRVAAFRRLLLERLSNDDRVFIVVEDAERCGVDALVELEALTATDSGESVGANIVLMGGSGLSGLLAKPPLDRLRQRIRLKQAVAPFDEAGVEGYMRHCLRSAGGDFEQIFEPGTAQVVHRYTGGIARVVDNLCESALEAAADAGLATILPEFLQEVAESCGFEAPGGEDTPTTNLPSAGAGATADAGGTVSEDHATPEASPAHSPPHLSVVATAAHGDDLDDIPTLSSSMRVAVLPFSPVIERPSSAADVTDDTVGWTSPGQEEQAPCEPQEVEPSLLSPGATREPGLFELALAPEGPATDGEVSPDDDETAEVETLVLDETPEAAALTAGHGDDDAVAHDDHATAGERIVPETPELDVLQAAIRAAGALESGDGHEAAMPADDAGPAASASIVPEIAQEEGLDRWAEELSKARSLEDISDMLAETLFGSEEMQAISAEIRARKAMDGAEPPVAPAEKPDARSAETRLPPPAAPPKDRTSSSLARSPAAASTAPRPAAGNVGGMTVSQRIEMVKSLKGRPPPHPRNTVTEIVLAVQPDQPAGDASDRPETIESQIDTAITQSRKALSDADIARMADQGDGGDKERISRGLFGFLRRPGKS